MAGGLEEESGSSTGFGVTASITNGDRSMMNTPHLRPARFHPGSSRERDPRPARRGPCIAARRSRRSSGHSGWTRRAGRPIPRADLTPVRLRPRGTGLMDRVGARRAISFEGTSRFASRADESGGDIDVEVGDLAGRELGQGDPGHGGVVGAERRRRDEQLDAELGRPSRPIRSRNRRIGGHAAPDPSRFRPGARRAPGASWRPGRRRRPPGSWRPGRRCRPRRARSRVDRGILPVEGIEHGRLQARRS